MISDDQPAGHRVRELADELTRVRQRGLDDIDFRSAKQRRIRAPHLERLARAYSGDEVSARTPLIRQLLGDALDAWEAEDHPDEAAFVRRLFFAPDGGTPGRQRPGILLDAARDAAGLPQDSFDDRRRAYFRLFASFLIEWVDARQAGHDSQEDKWGVGRRWLMAATAVLLAVALIAVIAPRIIDQQPSGSSSEVSTGPASSESGSPSPDRVLTTFTFDALGPGPQVISVYPGVSDTPADRRPNGAFNHGETVAAICKTRGRTVSSDTSIGEEPRRSDVWIRIDAGVGEMYATFVYGEMSAGSLRDLPDCSLEDPQ